MSKETIGPNIKRFRKRRKLTQEQLALSLGYSGKSVISHIEKGDADMTYEKMLLLLRTYMADANELFEVQKIDKLIEDYRKTPKHDKVVVYIHGLHGSAIEIEDYSFLKEEYDLIGLDYEDGNPWELEETIKSKFEEIIKPYKEVVVIANSIGAFYAYEYLSSYDIKQAFFISPIASMPQLILNIMMSNGVTRDELKEKKLIMLDDGTVLSYNFYKSLQNHKDNWNVPTDILFGERDKLVYIENIIEFMVSHPNTRLTIKKDAEHYFHTEEEKEFIKDWILKSINRDA